MDLFFKGLTMTTIFCISFDVLFFTGVVSFIFPVFILERSHEIYHPTRLLCNLWPKIWILHHQLHESWQITLIKQSKEVTLEKKNEGKKIVAYACLVVGDTNKEFVSPWLQLVRFRSLHPTMVELLPQQ